MGVKSQEHPLRPSSLRKREAILAAAEAAFLGAGYDAVTMDDIAAAAGVSKQTLYSHFGTKDQLFVALVTDMTRVAGDAVQVDRAPATPTLPGLQAHLEESMVRQLTAVLQPRILQLRRLVIGEVPRFPALAEAVYDNGPQRAIEALTKTLRGANAIGILEVQHPRSAAAELNWLVMGEPVNRAMFLGDNAVPTARELRAHVKASVAAFLQAYRPATESGPPSASV